MFSLQEPRETSEHTASYYAASAHDYAAYPPLQGEHRCDVAIVGAGFSGVNTALELAERGYSVIVLEANRVGWGATGRNGGQVVGGIGERIEQFEKAIGQQGIRAIYDMGIECCEIIRQRVADYAIDCDLTWGYCDVAIKPRQWQALIEEQSYQQQMGYPYPLQLLDADTLRDQVGSTRYIGGLFNPRGFGHLHPLNLCLGEAHAASRQGTRIFEQSRVNRLVRTPKPRLYTEDGQVVADYAVLCGNAYLGNLVPELAARVLPTNSSMIATAPLDQTQIDNTLPNNVAVCDLNTVLDYFRLSADKRLLFGGLANYTGLQPNNIAAVMRKKMLAVFPDLHALSIDYAWSGQIGIGRNRMPQLQRLTDTIYTIQGFAGHGVAPSHMLARLTTELIAGQAERFDVFAKIKHPPFPGGYLLRQPMLALGMLYHRVMDLL